MATDTFLLGRQADNVAIDATWSLTHEDPDYPASNAGAVDTDDLLPKPALSTATTDDLVGDLGGSEPVNFAVIWHNLDAGLANVALQFNATNSWGSPSVNVPLTIPAKRGNGYTTKLYVDVAALVGSPGLRWVRLHVPTANSVPVGFKVLLFTDRVQFDRDFKWGVRTQQTQLGIELTTDSGFTWRYSKQSAPRLYIGQMEPDDVDLATLVETFEATDGQVVALVPDPTVAEAWLVRWRSGGQSSLLQANGPFVTTLDSAYAAPDFHPLALTFEEITAGAPEWT